MVFLRRGFKNIQKKMNDKNKIELNKLIKIKDKNIIFFKGI